MLVSPLDRASARKLLDLIPTDADFDAFCLDFFPEVQARFASGMDRIQKTTLLLQLEADCECIAEKLRQRFENFATGTPARANLRRPYTLPLVIVGVTLLVATGLLAYRLSGNCPERVVAPSPALLTSPPLIGQARKPALPDLPPAGGRQAVEQEGDIHAKGRVNITVPSGSQETTVKTHGRIESGGDVNIGVIAPAASASVPRRKDAQP